MVLTVNRPRICTNLYDHMAFSIFDLLWVRDFNIEIHVEIDYNTCKEEVDYDDDALDWSERDFYECWTI